MTAALIFIGLTVIFAVGKMILEKRLAPIDASGDERFLSDLAFSRGCSVYELFRQAGAIWRFSGAKIDQDFKAYISSGRIPPYLQTFLKQSDTAHARTYQQLLYAGGRPPYL